MHKLIYFKSCAGLCVKNKSAFYGFYLIFLLSRKSHPSETNASDEWLLILFNIKVSVIDKSKLSKTLSNLILN